MAGLWDRIEESADDRVHTHLIVGEFKAYGQGLVETDELIEVVNAQLRNELDFPSENDIENIAAQIDDQASDTDKLNYLNKLEWLFVGAEDGRLVEDDWREQLNISF
jgi:hypothetical protein